MRCGIIFIRYRTLILNPNPPIEPDTSRAEPLDGPFRRYYRIFLLLALIGVLAAALLLMLRPAAPPQVSLDYESTKRAEAKIEAFQSLMGPGNEHRLELDQSELNGWLAKHLALQQHTGLKPTLSKTKKSLMDLENGVTGGQPFSLEVLEQLQSSIRDIKIVLLNDVLCIHALFDLHGLGLSLELEGKPIVYDGFIKLEPSGGKLNSLPMTAGTMKSIANYVFNSPQNREKFKLSPDIQSIRIEKGHLIIISRR